MNFNKVIIAGRHTRDPELRYTPKGVAVAGMSLAVSRTWKNEAGEKQEETTFVDVTAFGRMAEVVCQYQRKGDVLLMEGRLKLDEWEDKNTGDRRTKLKVIAESITLGPKSKANAERGDDEPRRTGNTGKSAKEIARENAGSSYEPAEPVEDDVPF